MSHTPAGSAPNYFLAFGWFTASIAGAVVGWWILTSIVQRSLPFDIFFSLPGILLLRGIVIGAAVGFFQWRALERLHARADRWILRTTVGYLAGSTVIGILTPVLILLPLTTTGRSIIEFPILIVGGVAMGVLQASGLRDNKISRKGWILAVTVGWTLGALPPLIVPGLGRFAYFPNAFTHGIWGMIVSLATLYPLRRLVRDGW